MLRFRGLVLLMLLSNVLTGSGEETGVFDKEVIYLKKDLKVTIDEKIHLEIVDHQRNGKPKLLGDLGVFVSPKPEPVIHILKDLIKLEWGPKLSLEIKESPVPNCHRVLWISELKEPLEDCFHYGDLNWFGGPEIKKQYWPIEKLHLQELPYVTQEFSNIGKTEPFWLNSKGVYIYVSRQTPLFIDTNNHELEKICFIANDVAPFLKRPKKVLEYNICSLSDPRKAQEHAVRYFFGKPIAIPDIKMVQHPIWSTWARYKKHVNETIALKFAEDIVSYGFNNSQIEIDDNWETCYGSTKFNTSRFSDMKVLSEKLKRLGFRTTIWVHPFVNTDCPDYYEIKSKGYFVKNIDGHTETNWWDGKGSVVDFTNPKAVEWYKVRYNELMLQNKIDGLKFDAGETSWMPQIPVLNCSIEEHPLAFTTAYVEVVSQFNPLTELRVSYQTQKYPMFLRMIDKDSKWSFNNGLPTLITTLLLMNIQGYSWVLPDMVGGNAYDGDKIDKELFIRWLQANTFMPSIQFSAAPWDYDLETIEISKKFTELHFKYSNLIIDLMKKTVETGAPLNPPIWWIDPMNPTAHKINSEFLLGEDILIAPVLQKGAIRRNIYLPKGFWKDGNDPQKIYKGRQWLKNYYADLSILPYFMRVHQLPERNISFIADF